MSKADEFQAVYSELRKILASHAKALNVTADSDSNYYVDTWHVMKNGKPLFFGAVQIRKNYVSYHLMPVYVHPPLLKKASAGLRKRMQGKSCFNFTATDDALFADLAKLTAAGRQFYEREGYIEP